MDYVVFQRSRPGFVIEVKREIQWPTGGWHDCREFSQAAMYAKSLDVPFGLVDRDRIVCFRAGEADPQLSIERARLAESDLAALRKQILMTK